MSELKPEARAEPLPNGFELTELNPDFLRDPHPILDRLREEAPRHVHAHAHFPDAPRGLYLTRLEDVRAIFADASYQRDPRQTPPGSLARAFAPPAMLAPEAHGNLLYLDGAQHRRVRGLVSRAFTPKAIAQKRPAIEAIASDLLAKAAQKSDFDAISEFAAPYPIYVIGDMLGFSRDGMPQFRAWSEDLIFVFNPLRTPEQDRRQIAAFAGLEAFFREEIARRRRCPAEDLLSAIIAARDETGDALSDAEIQSLLLLLLLAGNLTTADVIGNGLHALMMHPEEWAALASDPELAVPATEEFLRFGPPVAIAARYAPEDRSVFGCPVRRGAAVVLSLLGANRDPEAFDEPHAFRIRRGRRDHVAFGGGAHACLGAPLARLEIEIALRLLATHYPRMQLAAPAVRDRPTIGFVGFRELRLSLG
jgi:cytochrome P450